VEDFLNLFKSKAVGYAVLAFIIFTGMVDLKMANDPNARPDSNTGEQGRIRDAAILQLQYDIEILTAEVMEWQKTCEDRYDTVAVTLGKQEVRLQNNKDMISDCLRRTQ